MAIHVGFLNILSRILILEYQITTRVLVRFPSTRVLVDIPTLYPYKLLRINLFHIEQEICVCETQHVPCGHFPIISKSEVKVKVIGQNNNMGEKPLFQGVLIRKKLWSM